LNPSAPKCRIGDAQLRREPAHSENARDESWLSHRIGR
jgi:hypothetical protein